MLKAQVQLGHIYRAKISGRLIDVRIESPCIYGGGWIALNLRTQKTVRIRNAAKLRIEIHDFKLAAAGERE